MAELIVQGVFPRQRQLLWLPADPGPGRSAPLAVTVSVPPGFVAQLGREAGTGPGEECLGWEVTPAAVADRSELLSVSCRRLA